MDLDFEIYKNKKFSSICKSIVENSEKHKAFIDEQIRKLPDLITNLGEAMAVYPLMTSMIDAGTRNDEQLIKFASIIQKIAAKSENGESMDAITEDLQEQLESIQREFEEKEAKKAEAEASIDPVETDENII